MDKFEPVKETYRQAAMLKLKERMAAGEKAEDILQITDKFYLDKVISGLLPMSYLVYDRIMGCSQEDGIIVP